MWYNVKRRKKMPCDMMRDYQPGWDAFDKARDAEKKATAATRAACDMALALRSAFPAQWGIISKNLSPETVGWIAQHDAEDARRKESE
jgi:hypothetical protein